MTNLQRAIDAQRDYQEARSRMQSARAPRTRYTAVRDVKRAHTRLTDALARLTDAELADYATYRQR